ncbi:alpha/beta hydrolase [Promicromonospora sukumoe]|uniref:alpha/beta hydrolase n=1 Tax=Promicromonospora sukumoe TaxID=88382 RepID=UPI0037CA37B2
MLRRQTLIASGLTVVLLAAGCAATPDEPARAPDESAPSAGLAAFHEQEIEFEPCASYATSPADEELFDDERFDCSRVEVPLDYAEPDGARGEVALLRVPARGDKIGSLLVNPGGPGASGMVFAAALVDAWAASEVGERFDVVGFDTRGVGASTPAVDCYSDEETDRNEPPWPYLLSVTSQEEAEDVAGRCVEGTGGVAELTSVGSANVVQDMDVLRAVLGDDQLSYLGYSYGSELAAMYAEAYPQNVRAIVIDGAVDPELSEPALRQSQFTAFQKAFDGMAALCAEQDDCPLGTDPGGASAEFRELVAPLRDEPAPTSGGRALTYEDALQAMTLSLLSSGQWPALVEGLAGLADGDGTGLLTLHDLLLGRGADGRYGSTLDMDANLATRCMDNPRTPAEQDDLLRHARDVAPFMALGLPEDGSVYECAAWPEPVSRDIPWTTGDVDVPPTLTVSVTGDPGTPHQGGINMASRLGGSLLTVEGAQHGVALYGGSACVDDVVTDYLVDLRTPPEDARCTL